MSSCLPSIWGFIEGRGARGGRPSDLSLLLALGTWLLGSAVGPRGVQVPRLPRPSSVGHDLQGWVWMAEGGKKTRRCILMASWCLQGTINPLFSL